MLHFPSTTMWSHIIFLYTAVVKVGGGDLGLYSFASFSETPVKTFFSSTKTDRGRDGGGGEGRVRVRTNIVRL